VILFIASEGVSFGTIAYGYMKQGPGWSFDRMAIRFGSGFHHSRIHSSGVSSEAGTPRAGQHLVEVDVSLPGDLADSCR
jgi:hypothetical protein